MRFFGVELELDSELAIEASVIKLRDKFIRAFPKLHVNSKAISYYRSSGNTWDFKTDSSVLGEAPFELCTPKLKFPKDLQILYEVVQFLDEECRVPATGGMHVHISVDDLSMISILNIRQFFCLNSDIIKYMVSQRRSVSRYCLMPIPVKPVYFRTYYTPKQMEETFPRDALNLTTTNRTGTVEVRLHHASLNWDEIYNWIVFWVSAVNNLKTITEPVIINGIGGETYKQDATIKSMFKDFLGDDYPEELYDYYSNVIMGNIYMESQFDRSKPESKNYFIRMLQTKVALEEYTKCAV